MVPLVVTTLHTFTEEVRAVSDALFSVLLTVDFTLLFRAALPSSLGSWVLAYEVANYVAN